MKCQICSNPGVNFHSLCSNCGWENDDFLMMHTGSGFSESYRAGFDLSEDQMIMWSPNNGYTPKQYLAILIRDGKIKL